MKENQRFISVNELERRIAALEKSVADMTAPVDTEKIAKELCRLQSTILSQITMLLRLSQCPEEGGGSGVTPSGMIWVE